MITLSLIKFSANIDIVAIKKKREIKALYKAVRGLVLRNPLILSEKLIEKHIRIAR